MSLTLAGALGIGAAVSAIGGVVNNLISSHAVNQQIQGNKELFDYQWNKAYSPQAQVKNLTAAGLNPAAQFGNGSAVLNSAPSVGGVSQPNVFPIDGTQSLTDLAQYIAAGAQEMKTGADVENVVADTELKKIQADRELFQNDLLTRFGLAKGAAELSLAQEQVRLAKLSGDDKQRDIAIKHWTEAKEKAMSECNEAQRDILQKELANKDIELDIRNRAGEASIGETKSRSVANYASAEASRAQAANLSADTETKTIFNKFYKDSRYQHSFMSQVVEQGREAVSKRLVTDRQAQQLEYLVEQAAYSNDMKEFSYWSGQVNQFVNTLGSAASQFYGAGALRELIKLRQGQQVPPASIRGFNQ